MNAKLCLAALLFSAAAFAAEPPPDAWRDVDPANLLLIDTHYGEVAVEMAPEFAPNAVARMRALARAHALDGKSFYRVVDGFVAQAGLEALTSAQKAQWPDLPAEFERDAVGMSYAPLGSKDLHAQDVGHWMGFPVGVDLAQGKAWIIHCPGTVAFARDNDPDSASTEFYIVIGEAPRRLDRNLTAFGRVIWGMQYVQKIKRGDAEVNNGVIAGDKTRDHMIRVRIASDLPANKRPHFQVLKTDSAWFAAFKQAQMGTTAFYVRPPAGLDICAPLVRTRKVP